MGMRQIDPIFAERILNKYSTMESYGFDDSSLVFFRERFSVSGMPSNYYTDLVLKLLVMYQNYELSGQRMNLNWNLLYQMISRQASGISSEVEKLLRPVREQLRVVMQTQKMTSASETKMQGTRVIHETVEKLRQQLRSSAAGNRRLRPLNGIGSARLMMRLNREREESIDQRYVEEWFQCLTEEESEQVWQNLLLLSESRIYTSAEHVQNQAKIYREMKQIAEEYSLREKWPARKRKVHGSRKRSSQREDRTEHFENGAKVRLVRLLSREPQVLSLMIRQMLTVGGDSRVERTITSLFRKYEDQVFRRTPYRETEREGLAFRIFTMMEKRFTEPGRAREAEKELVDILTRDFYIEEHELIRREEKREQSIQEKENRLQAFIRLMEEPKIMAVIRRRIIEADEERREHLEQWIRKFESFTVMNHWERQSENSRMTHEERQFVAQVKETFGREDAERLESYFTTRREVTDSATEHEIVRLMNRAAESVTNTYLSITRNENFVNAMGRERMLYMQNLVRERVHEPSSRNFSTSKRSFENNIRRIQRNYIQRNYGFLQLSANNLLAGLEIQPVFWENGQQESPLAVYPLLLRQRETPAARQGQWTASQTELLLKQTGQEREVNETRKLVETLNEKVEIQEKLVSELRKKTDRANVPVQLNIDQLTRQVSKKMEEDLRLEKMRRGLL